jgi:hypothetical protein
MAAAVAGPLPFLLSSPAAAQQGTAKPPDDLSAAREQTQRTAEQLRRFKVPTATEPSFAFRP